MTAFSKTQLPDSVNTVERLAVWAAMVLQKAANGATITAVLNQGATPQASVQYGTLADGQDYFVSTVYTRADIATINDGTSKPFLAPMEITNNAIHPNFTTA